MQLKIQLTLYVSLRNPTISHDKVCLTHACSWSLAEGLCSSCPCMQEESISFPKVTFCFCLPGVWVSGIPYASLGTRFKRSMLQTQC